MGGIKMEFIDPQLQSLLAFWHEKRALRMMPSRTDMAFNRLGSWRDNLALIEVRATPNFFRLCGSNLRRRFNGEMTRHPISALDARTSEMLQLMIAQVRQNAKPVHTKYSANVREIAVFFDELYLPLADDGVHTDSVLFASYPEPYNLAQIGFCLLTTINASVAQWI